MQNKIQEDLGLKIVRILETSKLDWSTYKVRAANERLIDELIEKAVEELK